MLGIPNILSYARIVLTFVLVYMILSRYNLISIVVVFAIAAITDFFDGQIARRFSMVTKIGKKLDMFADRILMIGVVVAFFIVFYMNGESNKIILTILLLMREMIALPFLLCAVFDKGRIFPPARKIAKLTTLLQGIAFPMIVLGWSFAIIVCLAAFVTGVISGCLYAYDSNFSKEVKNTRKK